MPIHEDHIETFIPKGETKIVILGTMGSINARWVNNSNPGECFYYNHRSNQFWNIIQVLFEPDVPYKRLSISEKKDFLDKWGIAMNNIVAKAQVRQSEINNPSDTVLFDAYKRGKISFKKSSDKFIELIKEKPVFFTSSKKPDLDNLVIGYLEKNDIDPFCLELVKFWKTPTRCNPQARSLLWKADMENHRKAYWPKN